MWARPEARMASVWSLVIQASVTGDHGGGDPAALEAHVLDDAAGQPPAEGVDGHGRRASRQGGGSSATGRASPIAKPTPPTPWNQASRAKS